MLSSMEVSAMCDSTGSVGERDGELVWKEVLGGFVIEVSETGRVG